MEDASDASEGASANRTVSDAVRHGLVVLLQDTLASPFVSHFLSMLDYFYSNDSILFRVLHPSYVRIVAGRTYMYPRTSKRWAALGRTQGLGTFAMLVTIGVDVATWHG